MILLTMVLIILLIFARTAGKSGKGGRLMGRGKYDIKAFPGFLPMTILCLVILYAPLAVVTIYSLNDSKLDHQLGGHQFPLVSRCLRWARNPKKFKIAAWNSFTIAIIAATVSTTIATLAATAMVRGGKFRLRTVSFGLISLPLMVPEIVTAVATLIFFNSIGFTRGYLTILVAHIAFCIPFAYMPIFSSDAGD